MANYEHRINLRRKWDEARIALAKTKLDIDFHKREMKRYYKAKDLELEEKIKEKGEKMTIPIRDAIITMSKTYQNMEKSLKDLELMAFEQFETEAKALTDFEEADHQYWYDQGVERGRTPDTRQVTY